MRLVVFAILTAALSFTAIAAVAPPANVLTVDGFGPVKIGMTVAQAEKALGAKLNMVHAEDGDAMSCGTGARADGKNANVFYMVEGGRIVRIDVTRLDEGAPSNPPIRTAKNVGIGSSETEVKAAYGSLLKVEPHPYLEGTGHYLVVKAPDGKRGIIFETENGKVVSFRAGVYPPVGYIEGCA